MLVAELLVAVLLPAKLETSSYDLVPWGTASHDVVAKMQAGAATCIASDSGPDRDTLTAPLADLQSCASDKERAQWKKAECINIDGIWVGPEGESYPAILAVSPLCKGGMKGGRGNEDSKQSTFVHKGLRSYMCYLCH